MNPKTAHILIVDDLETNRDILKKLVVGMGHRPSFAENGLVALAKIEQEIPDVVLLDLAMPEMDGFETLTRIKNNNALEHLPVIMITGNDETEKAVTCIENGADDYVMKPFRMPLLRARIQRALKNKWLEDEKESYRLQIEEHNQTLEDRVQTQVTLITSGQMATIFALSELAESRDPETGEHLYRMCKYCKILALQVGMQAKYRSVVNPTYIDNLHKASPLHDIGKVGIPDRILLKPQALTQDEFSYMKMHATIGADTLRSVDLQFPGNSFIHMGIEIAEGHHEKWDGSGYPHGQRGEDIPLSGRILALGDVYDALTSKRCYKDAFSHDKAKEIILKSSGTHFDPDIVDAFVASEEDFISVRRDARAPEEMVSVRVQG
jgi:putative two-component system response regulator